MDQDRNKQDQKDQKQGQQQHGEQQGGQKGPQSDRDKSWEQDKTRKEA